jgi:streptogramin lyase
MSPSKTFRRGRKFSFIMVIIILFGVLPLLIIAGPTYYITTLMGTGTSGSTAAGSSGTATAINAPCSALQDDDGSLYVSDTSNHVIRRMISNIVSTFAGAIGAASNTGDGGAATSGRLSSPTGICMDINNNLYIADRANNKMRIVSSSGIINTFAGTG